MAYGDGGFYFLAPVGRGQGYAGMDFAGTSRKGKKKGAKASLSADFKAHKKTKFNGVSVLLRPRSLGRDNAELVYQKERALFAYGLDLAEETLAKAKKKGITLAMLTAATPPVALVVAAVIGKKSWAEYRAAKVRKEYYAASLKYLDRLWAKTKEDAAKHADFVRKAKAAASSRAEKMEAERRIAELEQKLAEAEQAAKDEVVADDKAIVTDNAPLDAADAAEVEDEEEEVIEEEVAPAAPAAAKTVSTTAPAAIAEEEEGFISKYGLYAAGAVALGGLVYAFREKLGLGGE
jgi:hypothetical protein